MRHRSLHRCCGCVLAALLLSLTHGARAEAAERPAASATAPSPAAMAEYRRKVEEYTLARRKDEAEADTYWESITDKRRRRRHKSTHTQDNNQRDSAVT